MHDIGKVGTSAELWGKRGMLSDREWEHVQMHPYYTGASSQTPHLAPIGALASLHHERLDGSGYYRNLPAACCPQRASSPRPIAIAP